MANPVSEGGPAQKQPPTPEAKLTRIARVARARRCQVREACAHHWCSGGRAVRATPTAPTLGSLLQDFSCERLTAQRNARPRTIASYRDTFRLLLRFVQDRYGGSLSTLALDDLDAPVRAPVSRPSRA